MEPIEPMEPLELVPLPERTIYSVTRLNAEVRAVLGSRFPLLWVEGEISNLTLPHSGHAYFSLKDHQAQVRCALFRTRRALLRFRLENGARVVARARVNLYEPRGDFQLTIESLELAGEGALRLALEALKQRLAAAGLFAAAAKRPLPAFPHQIGVITSASGAALHDILSVLKRRFPALPVVIYPSAVQGEGAAAQLIRMVQLAEQRRECDLLILARGGGSLEDLAAFNDEALAHALFHAEIPIIAAIGHEIDFTIADFVADLRAATPSAAAEAASPHREELKQRLNTLQRRLATAFTTTLRQRRQALLPLEQRLSRQHPLQRLQTQQQKLDELEQRLFRWLPRQLAHLTEQLTRLDQRLQAQRPQRQLREHQRHLQELSKRLDHAIRRSLQQHQMQLAGYARQLHSVSPLATLGRGYSITHRYPAGAILRSIEQIASGDQMVTRLVDGEICSQVIKVYN